MDKKEPDSSSTQSGNASNRRSVIGFLSGMAPGIIRTLLYLGIAYITLFTGAQPCQGQGCSYYVYHGQCSGAPDCNADHYSCYSGDSSCGGCAWIDFFNYCAGLGCSAGSISCNCYVAPPAHTLSVSDSISCVTNGPGGWCSGGATLDISATDSQSGDTVTISGTIGGSGFNCGGANPCSQTLSEGQGNITYGATCSGGLSAGPNTDSWKLDFTPPTVGYSLSGGTPGGGGWYLSGPVTMTCTGSDALSGLFSVTGPQVVNGNGSYPLSCTATDNAGNTASTSATVGIDNIAPVVSLECNGSGCGAGWYTGNVTLTAGATDALSGVAAGTALVSLDSGATWSASATLADGVHAMQARANDVAGNTGTASGTVRVDATAPSATILCNGSACGGGWYTGPVAVSLSATDATSGVAPGSALISANGGATWAASTTLTDGIQNVRGRATDIAGNPVAVNWVVQIDSVAPAVTGTLSGGVMGTGGWYRSGPVTLTCTATDATSGVSAIAYGTRTATANGVTTLSCTATDGAGNSASSSTAVSIDNEMPSVQFHYSGNYCTGGWYNTPVQVSIEAYDLFSGIASLGFTVNGGKSMTNSTLSADGTYSLDGFATNGVGNTAHIGDSVQVDSTPPISLWMTENNSWVGGKATLKGTSTDLMSGIAEVFVSTDNGATWVSIGKTSPWSFTWDTKSSPPVPDGTYTILARADDNACNHEHTAKLIVNVDNTPPTLKLQDSFNLLGRSTQIFNSDAGSGLDRAVATISGNGIEPVVITYSSPGNSEELSWDGLTGDGKVAPFGIYTVVVDAWDKVGNHSQTKGMWVRPAPQSPTTIPSTNNSGAVTNNPGATTVASSPSSTGISSQRAFLPFWLLMLPMVGVVFWLLASGVAFTRDRRGVELRALGRSVNEYLSQSKINSRGGEEND